MKKGLAAAVAFCVAALAAFLYLRDQRTTAGEKSRPWFTAVKVAENVWRISDNDADNIYLVEGADKALLIDTGLGVAKLSDFARTLTSKPLTVVNTHGHPDHAGGNYQFQTVYAHPADFAAIRELNSKEVRRKGAARAGSARFEGMVSVEEAGRAAEAELLALKEGDVFDLGGRKLEVIETPGHTPGEIVLLDAANKAVFTGDNDNGLVWLFLPNSLPLEGYLQTLKKLQARLGEGVTIYPGHGGPLPAAFVGEQIACVESILNGTAKSEKQRYFAGDVFVGDAMAARYKSAAVAYNPDNLRAKK